MRWPLVVGAVGAGVFAIGALLLEIVMLGALSAQLVIAAGFALMLGALLVAIGSLFSKNFVPALGGAALPLALLYFEDHRLDVFYRETTIAVVGAGFALFAAGQLFARGVHRGVRAVAAIALVTSILAFGYEANGDPHRMLYVLAFGALAALGLVSAISLVALRHRTAPRPTPQ